MSIIKRITDFLILKPVDVPVGHKGCPSCDKTGKGIDWEVACKLCDGAGYISDSQFLLLKSCTDCHGTGHEDVFHHCDKCGGMGIIKQSFKEFHGLE